MRACCAHARDVFDDAPLAEARQAVRELVNSPALAHWLASPQGDFVLGRLSNEQAARSKRGAVPCYSRLIAFANNSATTPELTAADYAAVPDLIEHGEALQDGERSMVFVREVEGGHVVGAQDHEFG